MEAVPRVADIMALRLGWSEEKLSQMAKAVKARRVWWTSAPSTEASWSTVTDLHSLFKFLDTDATGYLDLKEFKIGASRLGLPFATTEEPSASSRSLTLARARYRRRFHPLVPGAS